MVAGVMGWPVAHSLSPRLHGYWIEKHGLDAAYIPMPVQPENLKEALHALPKLGFRGVNLTLPHKEEALKIVDEVEPLSLKIGAINTILIKEGGALYGMNTDAEGFIESLKQSGEKIEKEKAVILGAGGAARAVAAILAQEGFKQIILLNRTRSKAEAVAKDIGGTIQVEDWEGRDAALEHAGLLVNTTHLGMQGKETLEISLEALPTKAVVTDIVYNPLETALLKQAKQRKNRTVDGLGMLLHQARAGFTAWFGVEPQVTEGLRMEVLKGL